MKLSIVLAAYNGAETICAQLESILAQTRKPDEVLIFDDCSTDDTVETVRRFAAQYDPDGAIRLIQNEKNQGWRANFMQGFRQASGDVIFCADQDDVWHKDKLEKMTAVLEQHPEVRVLACNIHPFYEEGAQLVQVGSHQTGPTRWKKWRSTKCGWSRGGPAVLCASGGSFCRSWKQSGSRLVPMICCCGQWGSP